MGEQRYDSIHLVTSAISEVGWRASGLAALSSVKEPLFAMHSMLGRPHSLFERF
jgi:hypothetical protein